MRYEIISGEYRGCKAELWRKRALIADVNGRRLPSSANDDTPVKFQLDDLNLWRKQMEETGISWVDAKLGDFWDIYLTRRPHVV